MQELSVRHYFTFFKSLGGAQSFLQFHHRHRHDGSISTDLLLFFEPRSSDVPDVQGLGLTWRHSIRTARRRFRRIEPTGNPTLAIYHNCWGMPFLADLDGAARRIAFLHANSPEFRAVLPAQRHLLDGVLCISPEHVAFVERHWPGLGGERLALLPSPIEPLAISLVKPHPGPRPLVLGYCGRLTREEKRVERLPVLLDRLATAGIPFRFELLGDGPERPFLEQALSRHNAVFHGVKAGADYWRVLQKWDVLVFVSDSEGLPLSLLEGLSQGVVPIYPAIRSGGDAYVTELDARLLYREENWDQVCASILRLHRMPPLEWEELQNRCRQLTARHSPDAYLEAFNGFVRRIDALKPVSRPAPRRIYLTDWLPFGLSRRVQPRALWKSGECSTSNPG